MELRQLKYFLKAQELLSFTEAAHSLHISQSTLSQQVKQLEIELDVNLFNRIGRKIQLTEAGKLFVTFALQSVKKAEEGKLMINDFKNLKIGSINIGIAYSLRFFFINILSQYSIKFPNINIKIIYSPSHLLFEMLNRNEVDFILAFHEEEEKENLNYQLLFTSPMTLVCSKHSNLSNRKEISMKEISKLPLVIVTQDYGRNHIIHKYFSNNGLDPRFAIEVNDIPSMIDLVKSGNWYSIMIEKSFIHNDLNSIKIENFNLVRNAKIISLRDNYETNSIKEFKNLIFKSL